jgi:predicted transcriptional regulator
VNSGPGVGVGYYVWQGRRQVEKEAEISKAAPARALSDSALDDRNKALIDEGIKEVDAGWLIPHAEVVAWVRSWGRPGELPMPKPSKTV